MKLLVAGMVALLAMAGCGSAILGSIDVDIHDMGIYLPGFSVNNNVPMTINYINAIPYSSNEYPSGSENTFAYVFTRNDLDWAPGGAANTAAYYANFNYEKTDGIFIDPLYRVNSPTTYIKTQPTGNRLFFRTGLFDFSASTKIFAVLMPRGQNAQRNCIVNATMDPNTYNLSNIVKENTKTYFTISGVSRPAGTEPFDSLACMGFTDSDGNVLDYVVFKLGEVQDYLTLPAS